MKKITLVAVDDHKFIREMWALLFSDNKEIELTGDSGTFEGGIELIKLKRPDIVLLDINLQDKSGMQAVPLIKKFSPGTKIIAVSMHNEPAYAKKMLHLGAKAYITKNSSHKEVFNAIDAVMKGGIYICTEIKDIITEQIMSTKNDEPDIKDLSLREIEIVKLIKEGFSSKEIASKIKISTRTVEVHRHNILKKLKLKNTTSLINFINTTDLIFA
jgi:DNA-binding NarL/FixJ family response regulator